jgi:NitT/TauT family transport system substrate-binding protein
MVDLVAFARAHGLAHWAAAVQAWRAGGAARRAGRRWRRAQPARRGAARAALLVMIVLGCAPASPLAAPPASPVAKPAATPAPGSPAAPPPASAPGAAPAALAPLQRVTIGVNNAVTDAPLFLAEDRGYFREVGLEIALETFQGGAAMIAPLSAGQIDVGGGVLSTGLYNAIARGVLLRAVADRSRDNGTAGLVMRKELAESGRVRGPADIKGLRLALPADCIASEVTLMRYLDRYGITQQDMDMTLLPFTDMPAAIANGSIDLGTPPEPFATRIEQSGSGVILHRLGSEIQPYRQLAVIFYAPAFAEDRDRATRFMVAYLRGVRDYHDAFFGSKARRDDAVRLLVEKTTIKQPELYDHLAMPLIDPNGEINLPSRMEDQHYYLAKGCQSQPIDVARAVDSSFAEAAVARLGRY